MTGRYRKVVGSGGAAANSFTSTYWRAGEVALLVLAILVRLSPAHVNWREKRPLRTLAGGEGINPGDAAAFKSPCSDPSVATSSKVGFVDFISQSDRAGFRHTQ